MIEDATEYLLQKKNLEISQMAGAMEEIMSGHVQTPEIAAFLIALSQKGETVEEITAAAQIMRKHATKIYVQKDVILDTCGTGGDKLGTFNVSTIAAFIASGCGITVAKHGNRSVSSRCGSADILEALGINLTMSVDQLEKCLRDIGIAFLFAPHLHPAMKFAMAARKQIAQRTIFNILGPLTNPAGATHQLVGVFDAGRTETIARVLANLGSVHALVVHGEDGLDEITTTGATFVSEACKGKIRNYQIKPEDFGLRKATLDDLRGGTAGENAQILLGILNGEPGPKRDMAVLNAGCAIYTAEKAKSIEEAIVFAEESIDSGKALKKLQQLKEYSKQ